MATVTMAVATVEASGVIKCWGGSNTSELEASQVGRHVRMIPSPSHRPSHTQPPTDDAYKSESKNGHRPFFSKKPPAPREEQKVVEPKELLEFEQETWDLFGLKGSLDHTTLLFECKVRAERGDRDAEGRLEKLHSFHKIRQEQRARWPGGDLPNWRDLQETNPDPDRRTMSGPHIWALAIGNDDYQQSSLRGAINDSKAWVSYLIDHLGVPKSQITRIENAPRATMVAALYDLRDNGEIKQGDHILVTYSGHGTSYDAKEHSFEDNIGHRAGAIEALCPVDRGPTVPDISDREILLILSEIRDQTKAEITVVLDCCHSGGGTRELDGCARLMLPLVEKDVVEAMFRYADEHPRRHPSTISVRSSAWASDTVNIYRPVLLAACQDTELAREEDKRGLFTSALMQVLRSTKGKGLTCSGLIAAISPLRYDQKPRFDGEDTVLFRIRKAAPEDPPVDTASH